MGTVDRSKKKALLWRKAAFHFVLCFVMGFLTGFAPTGKASIFSTNQASVRNRTYFSPQPIELFHQTKLQSYNSNFLDGSPAAVPVETSESHEDGGNFGAAILKEEDEEGDLNSRGLIIIVTPTSMKDTLRGVRLRRLANTLRLVAQPLLWVVVEQQFDSDEVGDRQTGIMYRHLVFKTKVD